MLGSSLNLMLGIIKFIGMRFWVKNSLLMVLPCHMKLLTSCPSSDGERCLFAFVPEDALGLRCHTSCICLAEFMLHFERSFECFCTQYLRLWDRHQTKSKRWSYWWCMSGHGGFYNHIFSCATAATVVLILDWGQQKINTCLHVHYECV